MVRTAKKTKTKKPGRIAGDSRIELAKWLVGNSIRLYGIGCNIDSAAELAADELGFEVLPATLARTSKYLLKIGAIKYGVRKRRQIDGAASLSQKQWAGVHGVVTHMSAHLRCERWTVQAVQRRVAREVGKVSEAAIVNGLKLAGFMVDAESGIDRVVWKKNR